MSLETLSARLLTALEGASLRADVQQRLSPRLIGGAPIPRPAGARQAAALLLLFAKGDRPYVVLTLRASHLPHHADQVSLPGGRIEPGETPQTAALREAHEEIGVRPEDVRTLGTLTPVHIPVSGYTLHIVVGIAMGPLVFRPDPGEVAQVLEAPLDDLMNPSCLRRAIWTREGRELDVPYFEVAGHHVWGATAMALCELMALAGYDADPWSGTGKSGV
jgi:8-oxo-dGTP pyrophosphatase MutT (NUDIX family)